MPFYEVSAMDQRREFVEFASREGANVRELCRRFGISPTTGYKWLERYRSEGLAGLVERSRRPHSSPQRTVSAIEARVLQVRDESNDVWGGRKIRQAMKRHGELDIPAASTITAILRRHDRLTEATAAQHSGPWQRFEREAPNELWQMDFKVTSPSMAGAAIRSPRSTITRASTWCCPPAATSSRTVRRELEITFRRYGLPLAMLMDGGPPWSDPGGEPYTGFSVWLLRLGIRVLHGRPRHPQTQGKEERFHRTLKAEVINGRSFGDLAECQRASIDGARYNYERPHEALDMATPAERYRPSPRGFPDVLPAIEYASGDQVRKVDSDGFISFRNRPWRLGKAFRGELVALRPTADDGVFSVHYCSHWIATLNLRQGESGTCGLVDNAERCPQGPQTKQQKQPVSS
ncbi:putative integrase; CP4-6 prophage [Mesorhizobium sp. ORS 3324]|nr:putative integrase; CP4-6 prophage [Mesorhizobium sp. ORS 3324]